MKKKFKHQKQQKYAKNTKFLIIYFRKQNNSECKTSKDQSIGKKINVMFEFKQNNLSTSMSKQFKISQIVYNEKKNLNIFVALVSIEREFRNIKIKKLVILLFSLSLSFKLMMIKQNVFFSLFCH